MGQDGATTLRVGLRAPTAEAVRSHPEASGELYAARGIQPGAYVVVLCEYGLETVNVL